MAYLIQLDSLVSLSFRARLLDLNILIPAKFVGLFPCRGLKLRWFTGTSSMIICSLINGEFWT